MAFELVFPYPERKDLYRFNTPILKPKKSDITKLIPKKSDITKVRRILLELYS
jgi:hypothetical protein